MRNLSQLPTLLNLDATIIHGTKRLRLADDCRIKVNSSTHQSLPPTCGLTTSMTMWCVFAALLCALPAVAFGLRSEHGMVASGHRLASEAGITMLRQGGNAIDAAIATSLALGVVSPSSCGIGGGGFMVVFDQRTATVATLDYREAAPAAATRDLFIRNGAAVPELSLWSGLAVAVPGEVAGLAAASQRFGSLPLSVVAAPAIEYARNGFPIGEHLAQMIAGQRDRIAAHPRLAALLFRADGTPLQADDVLRQPDLARTLEHVASSGAPGFYNGPVAEAIVATVRAAGGVMTLSDLADYRPIWRPPVHGRFDGYNIYSMPPPSAGGGVLVTILNVLSTYDLTALEHNSPTYMHLLAEAMQFAFADRAAFYGDPDFVDVPLAWLLSPARANQLRRRLSAATTFSPRFYGSRFAAGDRGTSHLSVIDSDGNAVACTTSVNTAFGSMLTAGDSGIILNNTMDDFSAQPGVPNVYGLIGAEVNAVGPKKRPLSSMSPTIVTRDGKAVAVAGGSGGPFIISGTLQALLNSLVFNQEASAALAAPRIHHQWAPPVLMLEDGIRPIDRSALRRLGHQSTSVPKIGAVQLIRRSPDGWLDGAADPRKGGEAVGW